MATLTVYPDPHAESTSVDGCVWHQYGDSTWATIRDGAGTNADDTGTQDPYWHILIDGGSSSGKWDQIRRGIYLFDTSALTSDATISATTLSLYSPDRKVDNLNVSPDINIYSSNPASNTALAAGDYDSLGTTPYATTITWANWNTLTYNVFTLNSDGKSAISKIGITKFGARNANYDVANTAPTWSDNSSGFTIYSADEAGTDTDPKLIITYTLGNTTNFFQFFN